jgi:hypothetical protein
VGCKTAISDDFSGIGGQKRQRRNPHKRSVHAGFVKTVEKKFLEPPVKNGDPLKNQAAVLPLRIKL